MINIKFQGDKEIVKGLEGVMQEISQGSVQMLDMAARETQVKMQSESPEASGTLKQSISIGSFSPNMRTIGPDTQYGYYQETRDNLSQNRPPLAKIQAWAAVKGFDSKAAFLIARKIAQSGYPANPFVQRTYEWVQGQINQHIGSFMSGIQARYVAGK